jgi:hypothetical protein
MEAWVGRSVLAVVIGFLSLAGGAAAASAPVAVTGAVTTFTETSATVSGTVNPNGQAATWYFDYGTSTSYGAKTPATGAGSGTTNTNVSATISGLTPGTTYHYRFVATNATGTSSGADGVFTTSGSPVPAAVTGSASNLSATSATLDGTLNPNGRATTWYFEYGTSTSYGTKTPTQNAGSGTSPVNVSAPVSGLRTGVVYHFRLVATNSAGAGRGGDRTFALAAAPSVTTGSASSVSATTANLNGTVDPNGQDTSWHFEFGTSTSYGTATAAKGAGTGTSATNVSAAVAGLTPGTTYHYRLVATNASGTTVGADRTFTTVGSPVVVTGAAQGVGVSSATLAGSVDPKTHTTSWYFEYGTSTGYGSKTPTQRADAGSGNRGVTAVISSLVPGTTYHYRIVASNSAGTSRGADVAFTTVAIAVSATTSSYKATYAHFVRLSGTISSGQAGVTVTVLAQRFGDSAFSAAATVLTGSGGSWSYLAKPLIQTTYEATWSGSTSSPVTIGVRPSVSLRVITGARLSTHVGAGTSFAGRFVQLQRLSGDRWTTVKRARLTASSTAIFHAKVLPRGTSTIRIAFSVNQAGPGYLAGLSRHKVYRRG